MQVFLKDVSQSFRHLPSSHIHTLLNEHWKDVGWMESRLDAMGNIGVKRHQGGNKVRKAFHLPEGREEAHKGVVEEEEEEEEEAEVFSPFSFL